MMLVRTFSTFSKCYGHSVVFPRKRYSHSVGTLSHQLMSRQSITRVRVPNLNQVSASSHNILSGIGIAVNPSLLLPGTSALLAPRIRPWLQHVFKLNTVASDLNGPSESTCSRLKLFSEYHPLVSISCVITVPSDSNA
ncbi:hypothetical protein VPH35_079458 [Triticum aestivum]|uniref:Uncharacterized protein n=1 Tax=Aegilops tauschii subsp. strangulata TaxID=200361 RepID=A0A453IUU6_AEGTS